MSQGKVESNVNRKWIQTAFHKSEKLKSKHLKASEEEKSPGRGKKRESNASDILSSFKRRKNLEGRSSEVTAAFRNKRCLLPSLAEEKLVPLRPNLPLSFTRPQKTHKSQWVFISIKVRRPVSTGKTELH